jgi:hypothetical protein
MKIATIPEYSEAINFLQMLRAAPWVLTAISPIGEITTTTAQDARAAHTFVHKWIGERNIYYSVNPTRTVKAKKAKKTDVAAIEFALADLDPADGESSEDAKARYLKALDAFKPTPTAIVDSGNGIQALWRLRQPIKLADPITITNAQGENKIVFPPETSALIADVEARIAAVMVGLGSVAGTQNIDRILRLPGTKNFPNAAKAAKGRIVSKAKLIKFASPAARSQYDLEDFPKLQPQARARETKEAVKFEHSIDWTKVDAQAGWLRSVDDLPADFNRKGRMIVAHAGSLTELCEDLKQAGLIERNYSSWSDVTMTLAGIFKANGSFAQERIAAALMCSLPCNAHVIKKPSGRERQRAVERALLRSHERRSAAASALPWRERLPSGLPRSTLHNARLAITALGIECRQDTFHHKTLVGYSGDAVQHELQSVVDEVTDDVVLRLRLIISDHFGVDFGELPIRDAVRSLALDHCFNPVLDMLAKAEAEWDGAERLDSMAVDYFNARDTPLNRAIVRKTMIALVKRARQPGCKFDTITVLESPEGWKKSGAWREIAGAENFSDQSILGRNGREVQEQLADVWLHESADLAGLSKSEVESIKAFASRQEDIARPAYGRSVIRQPRHSIEVGTTNDDEYLQSQTGNRRFWPIKVLASIDLEKLRADRLQLLGEAAKYESGGESVTLDERLWQAARAEQEKRRVKDDWEDLLVELPRRVKTAADSSGVKTYVDVIHSDADFDYVAANDILTYVLERPIGRREPHHSIRLAKAMRHVAWERTSNGKVTINGKQVRGYYRRRNGVLPLPNTTEGDGHDQPK